jgi:hypothetical protein
MRKKQAEIVVIVSGAALTVKKRERLNQSGATFAASFSLVYINSERRPQAILWLHSKS